MSEPKSPTPDPSANHTATPIASPPRRRRALLSYALIGAALCTSIVAIAANRQPPRPQTAQQAPAQATPPIFAPQPPPIPSTPARPRVELVFALDTTSSMSGLIEGAKRKIWSLASFIAKGQPTPDLRVGLVAYRDVGDEYVTRVYDLDGDLDRVYGRLRHFRAEGGGDTPEHVARALDEAVNKMSWSQDAAVVKVIYLVGDAPPHDDYRDGYDWNRAARAAAGADITVHTIRCGDDSDTGGVWRRIASLGKGQFMTVGHDGGMPDRRTPYDDELARLHDRLGETTMAYGANAVRVRGVAAVASAAPMAIKVERARYLAGKGRALDGAGDLVSDVASGAVAVEALAPTALPPELAGLSIGDAKAALAAKRSARTAISKRIDELSVLRDQHLESERKKAPARAEEGFDEVAKESLRRSVAARPAAKLKL